MSAWTVRMETAGTFEISVTIYQFTVSYPTGLECWTGLNKRACGFTVQDMKLFLLYGACHCLMDMIIKHIFPLMR
jgi:hypothetical protein